MALGRFQEATEEYEQLLASGYESATTYSGMGIAFFVGGDVEKAVEQFARVVELDHADEGFKNNYKLALQRQGAGLAPATGFVVGSEDETKGSAPFMSDRFYWARRQREVKGISVPRMTESVAYWTVKGYVGQ